MRKYRVSITADRYPTNYEVNASGWGTAISRAVRQWKKRFSGSRATEIKIHAIKGTEVRKEEAYE